MYREPFKPREAIDYGLANKEYEKAKKQYNLYLAKGKYMLDIPLNHFNEYEIADIQKKGYWYNALSTGSLKPITKQQKKFVNVMNGKVEVIGGTGASWIKYCLVKKNWQELYHLLKKINDEEREILASILKTDSIKVDDIISKLSSSSQNLNGLMGSITSYNKILNKVSKKLKLKEYLGSDKDLERQLTQHLFKEVLSKMDDTEKEKLELKLREEARLNNKLIAPGTIILSLSAVNLTGFSVYLMATTTLGALSSIIGVTLPFVFYTTLTSSIAFITGPVGWIGAGAYALWKYTDADYKKLIPSVVYIHLLREKYSE